MKDIALKTGFSVNTVSHALKDKEDIAEKTREYIKQTASEMGFIVDSVASSLRSGKTKTIAVIIGDIFNPHFGMWVRDIEIAAFKNGYSTLIINTDEDEEHEKDAIVNAISKRVDGIIICPTQKNLYNLGIIKKSNIPYITLGRRCENYNYIVCDDVKGGELATEYLIKSNCKRILFLNGPEYISSANERLEGYKNTLCHHRIEFDKGLVKTTDVKAGNLEKIIREVNENNIEFDGIFAFSDLLAFEAITELKRLKKERGEYKFVPIVGFDNILQNLILPVSMATIGEKGGSIAVKSFKELIKLMEGKKSNIKIEAKVDVELIEYNI